MRIPDGDSDLQDTLNIINSWNTTDFIDTDVGHFLTEEESKTSLIETLDQKPAMDDLDQIILTTSTTTSAHQLNNLAELKPLPPFTHFPGNININGIPGHHFHVIAASPNPAPMQIETNNNSVHTTNQNNVQYFSTDHVVSSSTMDTIDSIKHESAVLPEYLDDFAPYLNSDMADTTVPGNRCDVDDSRSSWDDLESLAHLIPYTSNSNNNNNMNSNSNNNNENILCSESLTDFVSNSNFAVAPQPSITAFHQQMKQQQHQSVQQSHHHNQQRDINTTFPHMSILQNRLQNVPSKPPDSEIYNLGGDCPSPTSSTPYLAHSPPCHVVSTSDMGYIPVHSSTRPSPELQGSFPHTTTPSKKSRNRTKSKVASSIVYNDVGKEKTVHRCGICNRGFLNKSNIKVHLRTHTGEKPFRCDVCAKAFRQKAHLIKHAQIHKRLCRE